MPHRGVARFDGKQFSKHLGKTAGWTRNAGDFYKKNDAPKQICVGELVRE